MAVLSNTGRRTLLNGINKGGGLDFCKNRDMRWAVNTADTVNPGVRGKGLILCYNRW